MNTRKEKKFSEVWKEFITSQTAKGISDATIRKYHQVLHNISFYFDIEMPLDSLTKSNIEKMVVEMRKTNLAHNSIATYVRVVKTFLNWCKAENIVSVDVPNIKENVLRGYMAVRGGAAENYLFCDQYGGMLSENALRLAIARYNQRRGVQKTSIHLFRHTFARKYLVDCGGNAFTLQKLLGHSTLTMTKRYCAIFDADIAKNYDRFSPLAQMYQPKEKIKKHL